MYQVAKSEPQWLPLFEGREDVRALFVPVTRSASRAAGRAAQAAIEANPDDPSEAGDAFSAELLRRGLKGFEGIAGSDGKALAADAAGVEAFLSDPVLCAAAEAAYVTPFLERRAEKNASSGSLAGTSAGRTRAKPTAATAASPAKTARTKSTPRTRS